MTNYDRHGHDIMTGKPLYVERVIDGELKRVPTPEMDHATYLLKDGSLMRVCISKESKAKLTNTPSERKTIMKKVVEGWKRETDEQVKKKAMSKKAASNYMKEYSEKGILDRIDDIPYRALANVDAEVLRVKKKMLKEIRKGAK